MGGWRRLVATCGNGAQGRLGHGVHCKDERTPRLVSSLVGYDVKQVACGGSHTAVLTEDGSLFTFGMNTQGQLGHSESGKFVPVPLEVGLPDAVTHVAAGDQHTVALTRAGEVWAWGCHESGQLGIGEDNKHKHVTPRLIKPLTGAGVSQLVAGAEHTLALAQQGKALYSWGSSDAGALGTGPLGCKTTQWEPRKLQGPLDSVQILQVASGLYSCGAVDWHHRLWTWGHGTWHQLGHGDRSHQHTPTQVPGLGNIDSVTLGHQQAWAVARDGRVWGWGTDENGSMGQGEGHWQRTPITHPKLLGSLPRCKAVAAGWKHSMAISEGGHLYSWGWAGAYNTDLWGRDSGAGQLGLGDEKDRWAPAQLQRVHTSPEKFYDLRMPFIKPWKALQVSCGRNHTAMVLQVDLDMRDVA